MNNLFIRTAGNTKFPLIGAELYLWPRPRIVLWLHIRPGRGRARQNAGYLF
jgi:hypothetical protein